MWSAATLTSGLGSLLFHLSDWGVPWLRLHAGFKKHPRKDLMVAIFEGSRVNRLPRLEDLEDLPSFLSTNALSFPISRYIFLIRCQRKIGSTCLYARMRNYYVSTWIITCTMSLILPKEVQPRFRFTLSGTALFVDLWSCSFVPQVKHFIMTGVQLLGPLLHTWDGIGPYGEGRKRPYILPVIPGWS